MFYHRLRVINWFFSIFGLKKPFLSASGIASEVKTWDKLWSFIVLCLITVTSGIYLYNENFDWASFRTVNETATNVIVLLVQIAKEDRINIELYSLVMKLFTGFNLKNDAVNLFTIKCLIYSALYFVLALSVNSIEVFWIGPPYTTLVRMPIIIESVHLWIHICVILSSLKIINKKISLKNKPTNSFVGEQKKSNILWYLIHPDFNLYDYKEDISVYDWQVLCESYYDVIGCMRLLEDRHGFQMLVGIWMIFFSAMLDVTLLVSKKAGVIWFSVFKSVVPLFWCYQFGFLNDKVRLQVEKTEALLMKRLIDIRCGRQEKSTICTFKQLVSAESLQFRCCGLFSFNYAMVLGIIVSVVTYSVIIIQLVVSLN